MRKENAEEREDDAKEARSPVEVYQPYPIDFGPNQCLVPKKKAVRALLLCSFA